MSQPPLPPAVRGVPGTRPGTRLRFDPARAAVPLLLLLVVGVRLFGWPAFLPEARRNVLVLGVDRRPNDPGRSDTMMLFSFRSAAKQATVVSIPRDTRVQIEGHRGYNNRGYYKINGAWALGGAELAVRTVERLLGVPVTGYVAVDMRVVRELVDAVGGVTVNIERRMDYEDPYDNLRIHFKPGVQRLNGQKAVEYLRYRGGTDGDIGRIARQQQFLRAFARELLRPATLVKLPRLLRIARSHLETDLTLLEQVRFGWILALGQLKGMPAATLPGEARDVDGVSYWLLDQQGTAGVVRTYLGGR